jgi:hypothetical protein
MIVKQADGAGMILAVRAPWTENSAEHTPFISAALDEFRSYALLFSRLM